jgi:hypothetical protein
MVRTGHPPKEAWALDLIGRCGTEGALASAAALRGAATTTDVATLDHLPESLLRVRQPEILQALLDIGGDAGATTEARVLSVRGLVNYLDPSLWSDYNGMGQRKTADGGTWCASASAAHAWSTEGAPLPADAASRIVSLASTMKDDPRQPVAVRSAADCTYLRRP